MSTETLERFVAQLVSPHTRIIYGRMLMCFETFLQGRELEQACEEDFRKFFESLAEHPSLLRVARAALRKYYGKKMDGIAIKVVKKEATAPAVPLKDILDILSKEQKDPLKIRDRAISFLALWLPSQVIVELTLKDIDLPKREVHFVQKKKKYILRLLEQDAKVLQAYLEVRGRKRGATGTTAVFLAHSIQTDTMLTRQAVWLAVKRFLGVNPAEARRARRLG